MFENLPKLNGIATVEIIVGESPIIVELNGNDAPITAGNFVDLVARGFYDNLTFHRVVTSPRPFVAQAGDPNSSDPNFPINQLGGGGFEDPETGERRTIPLEIKLEGDEEPTYNQQLGRLAGVVPPPDVALENDRGAIAMARSEAPDSASSQFYLVLEDAPFLDGDYAVFGSVIENLEAIDNIAEGDRIIDAEVTSGLENLESDANPVASVSISNVIQAEGDEDGNEVSFTVSLDRAITQTITLDYATADNTAIAGEDYTADNGTIEFAPGETEKTIVVQTLSDLDTEEDETFELSLTNVTNAKVSDAAAIATITDDDSEPSSVIELFRFRNTAFDTGTYIFVGEAERDFILSDPNLNQSFALDGVAEDGTINPAFVASAEAADDLLPFYRLESLTKPGTFLFVSTDEYKFIFDDPVQSQQWKKQGFDQSGENDIPEFYLRDGNADEGTKFNRLQNQQNGTFLYAGEGETAIIENDDNLSDLFKNQGPAFASL